MTDTALAETFSATPLAAWLASEKPELRLAPYRGVLTPTVLDALETETATLASDAAVHDLGWLRRVQVRGEDRFRWLSGMVTNTVNDLPEAGGAWNLVLNAQGRIQGELTSWRSGDELELEIAADQSEKLLAHLDGFIIMDDVELVPVKGVTAIGLTGPKAAEVLAGAGFAPLAEPMTQAAAGDAVVRRDYGVMAEHYTLWVAAAEAARVWTKLVAAGAKPVGAAAVEAFRIAEGIPAYGVDIAERDLPQETSQTRTLHFSKGCYLGQEIVERIRSRGNVHRHLRQLELDGALPAAGTELTLDGSVVGLVTSAAELPLETGSRSFALAMLKAEAEVKNLPLAYTAAEGAGTARILDGAPKL